MIIIGISSVEFDDDLRILSMTSPEGECVHFLTPIDPKNKNIEVWMVEVKDAMIGKLSDNQIIKLSNKKQ